MNDKEKIKAIKKVLDEYPKHAFYIMGSETSVVKDFEEALDKIEQIVKED